MEASTRECPQCGYDYMDFYDLTGYVRYICPDCGYTDEVEKNREDNQ
jgi:predicted RNA-binding Zn-ribbon protein involved in translation (DUF1610 family)